MKKRQNHGLLSLSLAMLAVLLLLVAPAQAQETTTTDEPVSVTVTTSDTTTDVGDDTSIGDDVTSARPETGETVTFSGNIAVYAKVVTDPAMPTGVTLFVDCKGLRGVGNTKGTVYINSCEANVTRLFRKTDTVTLTFAFFEDKAGSFLKAKTGVLTLNLTYDEATKKLTGVKASVAPVNVPDDGNV